MIEKSITVLRNRARRWDNGPVAKWQPDNLVTTRLVGVERDVFERVLATVTGIRGEQTVVRALPRCRLATRTLGILGAVINARLTVNTLESADHTLLPRGEIVIGSRAALDGSPEGSAFLVVESCLERHVPSPFSRSPVPRNVFTTLCAACSFCKYDMGRI